MLRGSERVSKDGVLVQQPKTQRAGAYPTGLTDCWSRILLDSVQKTTRDSGIQADQLEHELRCSIKKSKARTGEVSDSAGLAFHVKRFEKLQPEGIEAIVFGQHSNEEAQRRQAKQTTEVKEQSLQRLLGFRSTKTSA